MLTATGEGGGAGIPPLPAGLYTAICYGLIDLGFQRVKFQNQPESLKRKIMLLFEVQGEFIETTEGEKLPRVISKQFNLSLHPKSSLHKMLLVWRAQPFSETDLKNGFDLRLMVGQPAQLSISNSPGNNGKTYANIDAIIPVPKGTPTIYPTQMIIFDLDDKDTHDVFGVLPPWIQNIIQKSESYYLLNSDDKPWATVTDDTDTDKPY